jgi:hypothetical protein
MAALVTAVISGGLAAVLTATLTLYTQRKGSAFSRRWIESVHFECFQDVAECASAFAKSGGNAPPESRLGVFERRLRHDLEVFRDSLKTATSLTYQEYRRAYASLVEAEQVLIFGTNPEYSDDDLRAILVGALQRMRDTQDAFNKEWPVFRTYAESGLMKGEEQLS